MKQLTYTAKRNTGFVRTAVNNTSIAELLDAAKAAEKVVICNKTCVVAVHMGAVTLYFDCLSEVTFTTVETKLLEPYTRLYNGKLAIGNTEDTDLYATPHETVLLNYGTRLNSK